MEAPSQQSEGNPRGDPDAKPDYIGGRYRLAGLVGRGGMGEVFRAKDEVTGRTVALKSFKLGTERIDERRRFRREFHTLARLRHPRVVEVYDFGLDGRRPFYTMELLDGQDLGEMAPVAWKQACPLLRDIASALAFLHTHGLLHRDIAPRNVRCTSDGRAKLLDFGMLATMGVNNEVVGTLPSIAPEMILGLPMDGRADLYGLGALAFWLLTGRHPGRIRSLDELLRHGRRPPPPPSTLEPSIPRELDDLILSLLASEPLARPASAAQVIDQVESIGGLAAVPELEAARGYVHSAALVGRKREMTIVQSKLGRAVTGAGGVVVIEGDSGMGKTRLLREIELEAKLAGATVVRAQGGGGAPYALVRTIAEALIATGPDTLNGPGSTRVGQLLTPLDLAESTGMRPASRELDHREERLELQQALSTWLAAFSRSRPAVIIVDDLQRADQASAAVLASLAYAAHEHPLLLVGAIRSDDPAPPIAALDKLREQAVVIRPKGLRRDEVESLLRTVFGDASGVPRLAASMHKVTSGSPMLCIEIVRNLIDRGVVRYSGGIWLVPDRVDDEALPTRLEQAMDARIAGLGPRALRLCQALAVHGGELSMSDCVDLAGADDEPEAFAAIDELTRKGVVAGTQDEYALSHDGLVEATLRTLDPDTRKELELRVGQLLLDKGPVGPSVEASIGWHLVRGGKEERGAKMLARSGRRLFEATSFDDAVPHLEAAVDIYSRIGAPPRTLAELYAMLITAGFYCDREVAYRHAEAGIALLGDAGGIPLARKLGKVLGAKIGFFLAVGIAFVSYWFRGGGRRLLSPMEALRAYGRCVAYTAGTAGFSFDTDSLRKAVKRLRPIEAIASADLLVGVRFVKNLLNFNLGRLRTLRESSDMSLDLLRETPVGLTDFEKNMAVGGARFQRGLVAVRTGSPKSLDEIDVLRKLGPRLWQVGALQLRSYYHLWRGEEIVARRLRAETEVEFVRLGSLWQLDAVQEPTAGIISAYLCDRLGLKRAIEATKRLIDAGMNYTGHYEVAQAEYYRLRHEFAEASKHLDAAFAVLPEGEGLVRPWAITAKADLELDQELPSAVATAQEALAFCEDEEYHQLPFRFRAARTLAMARGKAGDLERAAQDLDALLREAKKIENPYVIGWLHEGRAEIAYANGEETLAEEHAKAMEMCFTPTRNPVLIGRCERLRRVIHPDDYENPDEQENDEMVTQVVGHDTIDSDTLADMMSVLSGCHTAAARAQRALELILATSGSERGFLFIARHGRCTVAAPLHGDEPPKSVSANLSRMVTGAQSGARGYRHSARFLADEDQSAWVSRILCCREGDAEVVIGALALVQTGDSLPAPPPALLEAIARRLFDAGDVAVTPLVARR